MSRENQDGAMIKVWQAAGFCGLGTLGEWKGGIDWMDMVQGRYVAIKAVWTFERGWSW